MPKFLPLNFILPLLIPMAVAGLLVQVGTGPSTQDVIEDLDDPDPDVRENALEWLEEVQRPSLLEHLYPLIYDPEPDVAEAAVEAVRQTASPDSLEVLDKAWEETDIDRRTLLRAYAKIKYPQTIPHLEQYLDHPDPEVRELAEEYLIEVREAINHEIVFFSLGNPIYNKLGHVVYSQAILFPEGRELVEGTSTEPEEGAATP